MFMPRVRERRVSFQSLSPALLETRQRASHPFHSSLPGFTEFGICRYRALESQTAKESFVLASYLDCSGIEETYQH